MQIDSLVSIGCHDKLLKFLDVGAAMSESQGGGGFGGGLYSFFDGCSVIISLLPYVR